MTEAISSNCCANGAREMQNPTPNVVPEELSRSHLSPFVMGSPALLNMNPGNDQLGRQEQHNVAANNADNVELTVLALLLEALKRTGLSCRNPPDDVKMDIGWPTNVQHVAHVTFDRFNGFLGLPVEFQREIPRRVPSASASVFGVSPESMQCSYDSKGNSIPTILLLLQERLYAQGGLKAEGVFRINAENSQEEHVRNQLNRGIVPPNIEVHCLAGLIKAWFRELPKGVLDSLLPEQVMQCQTEEQALALIKTLPPTQAALLDWAVNLMSDVVELEHVNKMNAHNIAMVFAPNMTQMSDPLTALMHAVQVMNLLKTLVLKTLRDRGEALLDPRPASPCAEPPARDGHDSNMNEASSGVCSLNDEAHPGKKEELYLNTFNERSSTDEYELARDSRETVVTELSLTDTYDEDELFSDNQANESSMMDSTDDDSSISKSRKTTHQSISGHDGGGIISNMETSQQRQQRSGFLSSISGRIEKFKFVNENSVIKDNGQCGVLDCASNVERTKVTDGPSKLDQSLERAHAW